MTERTAVTKQMVKRYQKATKKDKGAMLDELCALVGPAATPAEPSMARSINDPCPQEPPAQDLRRRRP